MTDQPIPDPPKKYKKKKVRDLDVHRAISWAVNNLEANDLRLRDAPTPLAYTYWKTAREDKGFKIELLKLLPAKFVSKTDVEGKAKVQSDDGRKQLVVIDALMRAMEEKK